MEKRLVLMMGMAVCMAFCVGCQPRGLSDAERTAIHQVQENDVKLTNAQDWEGDLALFTEDAILMPPNHTAIQGKTPIQAWMAAYPPFSNFQAQSLEVEGQGNLAYDRGNYSVTVNRVGAAPIEDHGKYLTILRKQAGGLWKITHEIYNSDLPLPAPEKPAVEKTKSKPQRHAPHRKSTRKAHKRKSA